MFVAEELLLAVVVVFVAEELLLVVVVFVAEELLLVVVVLLRVMYSITTSMYHVPRTLNKYIYCTRTVRVPVALHCRFLPRSTEYQVHINIYIFIQYIYKNI